MNFSRRTNWQRHPNRLSKLLDARRSSGEPILDLTLSNPTEAGIAYPAEKILPAIAQPSSLSYQPDPRGIISARRAVAQFYHEKNCTVDPNHIVLTASTSEAYSMLFMLLCNAGETVLIPQPSYPLFEYIAQLHDIELRQYRLAYDGEWHIDHDSLRSALTPSTRAIVLINPHNPAGAFIKDNEWKSIIQTATEKEVALIVDEVFGEYGFVSDPHRLTTAVATNDVLTFTLNGISKLCALPQMKLGWIVAGGPAAIRDEAMKRLEIVADTFLSVNTPVQAALPTLLEACRSVRSSILNRVTSNYEFVHNASRGTLCSPLTVEGGWNCILRVPRIRTDEKWALELLEQSGVYVYPGYFFDFGEEGYLVVSLLTTEGDFQRGIRAILQHIERA